MSTWRCLAAWSRWSYDRMTSLVCLETQETKWNPDDLSYAIYIKTSAIATEHHMDAGTWSKNKHWICHDHLIWIWLILLCYNDISSCLTHWSRVTHICVSYLTIIGSDNGLSPGRRQAIIWINAGIILIGPWGIKFSETFIEIKTFTFKKLRLKVSSATWRPFCLGLNVLSRQSIPLVDWGYEDG